SPRPRLPGARLETQRHLGVNAVPEVNPVCLILRGGEHELAESEQARIEIEWPRFRIGAQRRQLSFEGVRLKFGRCQAFRSNQLLEGEKLLLEVRAHRSLVIAGLVK